MVTPSAATLNRRRGSRPIFFHLQSCFCCRGVSKCLGTLIWRGIQFGKHNEHFDHTAIRRGFNVIWFAGGQETAVCRQLCFFFLFEHGGQALKGLTSESWDITALELWYAIIIVLYNYWIEVVNMGHLELWTEQEHEVIFATWISWSSAHYRSAKFT